jgi:hypothetical protein
MAGGTNFVSPGPQFSKAPDCRHFSAAKLSAWTEVEISNTRNHNLVMQIHLKGGLASNSMAELTALRRVDGIEPDPLAANQLAVDNGWAQKQLEKQVRAAETVPRLARRASSACGI